MKIKVKIEETRIVVTDKDDNVISIFNAIKVAEAGGLDLCIKKYKEANPKAEVEIIGALPTTTTTTIEPTTPAPEVTTTPAPEVTTTPAPEVTTTPAPEVTTTPAPAV